MKVCPKCKRTWPDAGRFCPMDGTGLVAAPAQAPSKVDDLAKTVALPPEPSRDQGPKSDRVKKESGLKRVPVGPSGPAPARSPAAAPSKPAGQKAAPVQPAGVKKAKGPRPFSETKWFMVGEAIKDEEVEPQDVPVEDLQKIYRKTSELPDDVRKKFSLTFGTSEDAGGEKKK